MWAPSPAPLRLCCAPAEGRGFGMTIPGCVDNPCKHHLTEKSSSQADVIPNPLPSRSSGRGEGSHVLSAAPPIAQLPMQNHFPTHFVTYNKPSPRRCDTDEDEIPGCPPPCRFAVLCRSWTG